MAHTVLRKNICQQQLDFRMSCKANPKQKVFLKNFQRFKKIKNATHTRQDNDTETLLCEGYCLFR